MRTEIEATSMTDSPQEQEQEPEPSDWLPSSNWQQPLKQIMAYGLEVILQVNDASLEFDTHNTFYTTAANSARTIIQDDLHYYTSHPDRISLAAVAIWSYLIRTLFRAVVFVCLCSRFGFAYFGPVLLGAVADGVDNENGVY